MRTDSTEYGQVAQADVFIAVQADFQLSYSTVSVFESGFCHTAALHVCAKCEL